MLGIEPRVGAEQVADASDHQAGAHQQHDGEGDVGGDEQPPSERCRRVRGVAPFAVQRAAGDRCATRECAGTRPKMNAVASETAAENSSTRPSRRASVRRDIESGGEHGEQRHGQSRRRGPRARRRDREQGAFDQQLPDEPRAARAQRGRSARSCSRRAVRASSRLATFAHAISSTQRPRPSAPPAPGAGRRSVRPAAARASSRLPDSRRGIRGAARSARRRCRRARSRLTCPP